MNLNILSFSQFGALTDGSSCMNCAASRCRCDVQTAINDEEPGTLWVVTGERGVTISDRETAV